MHIKSDETDKTDVTPVLIGADPEFFLKDGDDFVSAHDIVPGDKDNPFPLRCGSVQSDGTAVEFQITPSATAEEFCDNIATVLNQLRCHIPRKYKFSFSPVAKFNPIYFKKLPLHAIKIGCLPDFTFVGARNSVVTPQEEERPVRFAGGHLHIGWTKNQPTDSCSKHFDVCVSLARVLYFGGMRPFWEACSERQFAGNFRPKSYGIEYRHFSNEWLAQPVVWPALFKLGVLAGDFARKLHWRKADSFSKEIHKLIFTRP